ncbi:MAG: hypothetical protein LC687_00320 [Actinobacteria bacterium]|nr:hypothetical protein [Actinomycetota bacterium]MCA1806315.1 hypothetical protein [Actinomycetota bacterium]
MHTAIITPRENLFNFSHLTRFDMMVPDHFTGAAANSYKTRARRVADYGHYIILDNGTYERGVSLSGNDLMNLAVEIGAREIVLPDYWKKTSATHHAVHGFLEEHWETIRDTDMNLMIVAQSEDASQWVRSLKELQYSLKRHYVEYGISSHQITWGIPKWVSETYNRLELVRDLPLDQNYHLLGLSDLSELMMFNTVPKNLRSMDTSFPIRAAIEGRDLFLRNPVKAGTEFMDAQMNSMEFMVACYNVTQLLSVVPNFTQYGVK